MSTAEIIQLWILIVFAITLVLSSTFNTRALFLQNKSIKQQSLAVKNQVNSNETSLRPFVFGIPHDLIRIEEVEGKLHYCFSFKIKNVGTIPAFNLITLFEPKFKEEFPKQEFKNVLKKDEVGRGFVFPDPNGIVTKLLFDKYPNGDNVPDSRMQIAEELKKMKFNLHLYIEYSKKFAFQSTFYLYKIWDTQGGLAYRYETIFSSPEKIS